MTDDNVDLGAFKDIVRRTLEEARVAARVQGKDVGRGRVSPARRVAGNAA